MRCSALLAIACVALVASCAGRVPLPKHLEVAGTPQLLERMRAASSTVRAYSAEARITYFGKQGRAKGTATIAVERPASMRYELVGPHGGVLEAFATNGVELQLADFKNTRFLYGPATPANIDRLLPFAPLGLGAAEWVAMFFGELSPPATAALTYDDERGRFVLTWSDAGVTRVLDVDPASSRPTRLLARDAAGALVSEVEVDERDEHGLPSRLRLRVPPAEVDLELRLRDLVYDPELDDAVFVLDVPRGVIPERL